MPETAVRRSKIAAARSKFIQFGRSESVADADVVASVVSASWQRSFAAGVNAATTQAVFHEDLDLTGRLVRCARPVITRLSDDMSEMPLSIVLTDSRARILSRSETDRTIGTLLDKVSLAPGFNYAEASVGTNGIGTVLESGQSLYIVGPEHFHEHLQPFACAGSPIRDPLSGRIEGVLDITCLSEHSSPLMNSLVRSAAHEIERNLLVDRSQRQQALFEAYVKLDSRSRGAVMAIGGSIVMGNAVAQNLFEPAEQWTIHEHGRYLMTGQGQPVDRIQLSTGKVVAIRGNLVVVGKEVAGIVMGVDIVSEAARAAGRIPVPVDLPAASSAADPVIGLADEPSAASIFGDGRSLLGKRTSKEIVDALHQRRALLVMGESGCGKLSLVVDLYRRVVPEGQTRVISAADVIQRGLAEEEHALELTSAPTLHIFTNIDQLDVDGVAALSAFLVILAEQTGPVSVAATLSGADLDSRLPFTGLLDHFDAAVTVAPLRHRLDDVPLIVTRVLANMTGHRGVTLSPAALRVVSRYTWPRNIRQLEEALESALMKRPVGEIQAEDLPGYCHSGASRALSALEAAERDLIVNALQDADGNRVHAAEALGIARSSLYRKLKNFGITAA
ncbi:hypothetical protein RCH16_001655 [Cryobacterium sp. MP_M5]|uniref:sigma-54-dependent Fis family transcriptional regulator n=1 Tax=unclassified Cryobacterium TaxID=2649013 RepID=UPI0018CA6A2A|nr:MULTISPECIES: helix-turn-helix domain-containing protein [unclassified Cryobacterium]MBG6058109.1 hypothetical protein [Cryobacterium sp. MP_M3]MEC5176647.1 hypothetical protein [Cryobacterium sp. MP_M5]